MSSVFGEFIYIMSLCGDYTRKHSVFSQIHAVFICFTSFRIVFHSFWCRMMCFVCETMYSALFSVITTWFKGALIDFYIKICYNIYIRNVIFLECFITKEYWKWLVQNTCHNLLTRLCYHRTNWILLKPQQAAEKHTLPWLPSPQPWQTPPTRLCI